MVTGGFDGKIRVWDIRQYKPVNCFPTASPPSSLDISQRGLLAFGYGNRCEVSLRHLMVYTSIHVHVYYIYM